MVNIVLLCGRGFVDFKPTVIGATPTYMLSIDEMERRGIDPRSTSLNIGVFGAEPWSHKMRQSMEERLNFHALDAYGLSEVIGPDPARRRGHRPARRPRRDSHPHVLTGGTQTSYPERVRVSRLALAALQQATGAGEAAASVRDGHERESPADGGRADAVPATPAPVSSGLDSAGWVPRRRSGAPGLRGPGVNRG
jgi:hypothetical protein